MEGLNWTLNTMARKPFYEFINMFMYFQCYLFSPNPADGQTHNFHTVPLEK